LTSLKERIEGAHSADMDRGARILAYHRYLMEYRRLAGVWAIRISSAQATIDMTARQQKLKAGQITVNDWTPQTDIQIARDVLKNLQ
jgi:phage baseplate assembly protein gpV